MAREFPHAEVLGIDLEPTPIDAENLPTNCRFQIDNINMGKLAGSGIILLVHRSQVCHIFKARLT